MQLQIFMQKKHRCNVNIIAPVTRPSRRPQLVSCIHIAHSAILKLHVANHPASPTIRLCFLLEEMQTSRIVKKKRRYEVESRACSVGAFLKFETSHCPIIITMLSGNLLLLFSCTVNYSVSSCYFVQLSKFQSVGRGYYRKIDSCYTVQMFHMRL